MAASEGLPLLHDAKLSPRSAAAVAAEEAAAKAKHRRNRRIAYGVVAVAIISLLVIAGTKSSSRLVLGPNTASYSDTPYAKVMQEYRASHDFDGVVQVTEDGEVTFADWSGLAVEEFDVPIQRDSIFPIGSNSKLFAAVALYQLQERGVVNLSEPVNLHLDAQDFANFGFPNQTSWCPRVAGAVPDSPCENITFVQLMHMGSGIGDSLNCDNVPPERCYATADNLGYYKGSLGPYIGVFINDPLVFKPDADYSYSNPNYYLLSYLVEKLSGQSFAAYLDEHIIRKIGLNDTYYDPYSGALGVRKGYVQQYIHYYAQAKAEDPRELLATGTCAPYINSGAISGSGGLRSTVRDMQRWFMDLFAHRGTQSKVLNAESIRMLVDRVNPVNHMYGQGIGVGPRGEDGWPSILQYCGGMKCAVTCMTMVLGKGADADSSAVISSFSSHMHYTFADRAAFEKYKPTELLAKPPSWGIVDDGGATGLLNPLLREYLAKVNGTLP